MKTLFVILGVLLLIAIFFRRYEIIQKGFTTIPFLNKRKKNLHPLRPVDYPGEITAQEMIPSPETVDRRDALRATTILKKAAAALAKGDMKTAEKLAIQSIAVDPSSREAYAKLGLLYLGQEQFSKAEMIFRRLTLGEIQEAAHFSNLGLALYHQNKLPEARIFYEKAIELDASRAGRFFSLAKILHELNEFDLALQNFRTSVAMDPKNLNYLLTLAQFYRERGMKEEVRQLIEELLMAFPGEERVAALGKEIDQTD